MKSVNVCETVGGEHGCITEHVTYSCQRRTPKKGCTIDNTYLYLQYISRCLSAHTNAADVKAQKACAAYTLLMHTLYSWLPVSQCTFACNSI